MTGEKHRAGGGEPACKWRVSTMKEGRRKMGDEICLSKTESEKKRIAIALNN